jgi:hypothetical protein
LRLARTADPQTAAALREVALEHQAELQRLGPSTDTGGEPERNAETCHQPDMER